MYICLLQPIPSRIVEHHASGVFGAFYAGVFVVEVGGKALDVALGFPLGHGEVVQEIVATGGGGGQSRSSSNIIHSSKFLHILLHFLYLFYTFVC